MEKVSQTLVQRVGNPSLFFSPRVGVPLASMSVFELIGQTFVQGWTKSNNVSRSRHIVPFSVDREGPKIWYVKEGARPYKEYLLALLTASERGITTVYHMQTRSYYSCLFIKPDVIPHQPAQFYRALMRRRKKPGIDVDDDASGQDSGMAVGKRKPIAGVSDDDVMDMADNVNSSVPAQASTKRQSRPKRKPVKKPTLADADIDTIDTDRCSSDDGGSDGSDANKCDNDDDSGDSDRDNISDCLYTPTTPSYADPDQVPADRTDQVHILDSSDDGGHDKPRPAGSQTTTNHKPDKGADDNGGTGLATTKPQQHQDHDQNGTKTAIETSSAPMPTAVFAHFDSDVGDGDISIAGDGVGSPFQYQGENCDPAPTMASGSGSGGHVVANPRSNAVASPLDAKEDEPIIFTPRVNSEGHKKVCSIVLPDFRLQLRV